MDNNNNHDRFAIMKNVILAVFVIILGKILYMTVFKYDHYTELAENKTYKELPIKAPRGEIRDTNGKLLAGNKNLFTVQVSGDEINKEDENGVSMANDISLKIIELLEDNKEEYIDEFPIYIENNKFYYTFDREIRDYKEKEGIPQELNAKESFYYIVDKNIQEGKLEQGASRLKASELQAKLNELGIYPPILVSKWMFTEEKNKSDWLESYKIKKANETPNISAQDAFEKLREYYEIDSKVNNIDARKIFVVRDLIKSQGYSRYNPVTIAQDISETTHAQIEENSMNIPGVRVANEPIRDYPNENLASHILGYVGKMPSSKEAEYLEPTGEFKEYLDMYDKKYNKNDSVGLAGIEKSYEAQLKGVDGYKKVQVDALGRITKELEVAEPKSGDTVYLSIDKELQEVAEDSLEKLVTALNTGTSYKSEFGNYTVKYSPNAKSGAIMAIDLRDGDVLASASYPDYDPNTYTLGISEEEYDKLGTTNPNDPLAASAMQNLATQGVFAPGSIFKLVTSMAALEGGLNPNYTINDPGVIYLGDRSFADSIWNSSRRNHGYTNLYKAIQESCNIYFYTLGTNTNWQSKTNLGLDMGPEEMMEYAKLFGLDEYSGLNKEIEERKGTVPTEDQKTQGIQAMLREFIDKEMENDFIGINRKKDKKEYKEKIDIIAKWTEEDIVWTRTEVIKRLSSLNIKEDRIEILADKIYYDYLKQSKWIDADAFNLSIGQGENAYTPAQMVRYTAALANGGYLVDLSVVEKNISSDYENVVVDVNDKNKIPFKNDENLLDIKKGMELVSTNGTGKSVLANFPIDVASKTGTAQKSGKIPTENEVKYLEDNMGAYGVSESEAKQLAQQLKSERESELTEERIEFINEELERKDLTEEERTSYEEEIKEGVDVKLDDDDKTNKIFLRRAIKELNPSISDEDIDRFKQDYDAFAWSIAYAPANDPEIALVCVVPQGQSGTYSLLPIREVIAEYMGLVEEKENLEEDEIVNEVDNLDNDESINFISQMKK